MKITELEIHNINQCKHAHIKCPPSHRESSVYLVHSSTKCEVISLSVQLICSTKYVTESALNEISDKIVNGKVNITFTLLRPQKDNAVATSADGPLEHSSDSDVPCTSRQARERQKRRLSRRSLQEKGLSRLEINACRNFALDPDIIEYSVNNSPRRTKCSAMSFQIRFFNCTDIFFPRLSDLTHGEYCQGRWLNLMSMDVIDKGKDENNLIIKFCNLYANHKITSEDPLCSLTTSVITASNSLNHARITTLIKIFDEIRFVFEYITNLEYTVWFLLPTVFGNMIEISRITTENINFDLMKTDVQLKTQNMDIPQFPWTQAEGHIQELLLVAIQLVFGYNCQQNIIYLHSLRNDLLRSNYFQRVLNICEKLKLCCVVEYIGGLPYYPPYAYVIDCAWQDAANEWHIYLKNTFSSQNSKAMHEFLQDVDKALK